MHKDRTIGQLICQKHANQLPTPWYKLNLVLEDETNEMNALIIGKSGEKLFGTTCRDLVRVYPHTLGAISKDDRGISFVLAAWMTRGSTKGCIWLPLLRFLP